MALRIGKKNQADDWSEESLRQELAQISEQDEVLPSQATVSAVAENDPFADFADAAPETTPSSTPEAPQPSDEPLAPETRRPKMSPVLLAGGLVFLIVAVAAGVWLAFFNAPAEDTSAPLAPPVARRPARPPLPPAATKVISAKPQASGGKPTGAKPAVKTTAGAPGTPANKVRPGKAVIMPKGVKAPAIAPKKPMQAPRVAPVAGVPTPRVPPPGMAGIPGKGSTATTSVEIVGAAKARSSNASPQLKSLWKQGADAKHRGDYDGARRAWTKILQLRPGHPGIQGAIDKLPQQ